MEEEDEEERGGNSSSCLSLTVAPTVTFILRVIFLLSHQVLAIRFTFTFNIRPLCRTMRFVNSFFALAAGFVLLAVARDRYNKICHPLDKPRSQARIKVYILICCLASLALSVVFAVLTGLHSVPTGVGNVTGITCSVDDAYRGTLFPLLYNLIMAVTFVGSVVTMGASYTAIALKLWRHNKKKLARESSKESRKDTSCGGRSDSADSGSKQVASTGGKERPSESGSSETRIELLAVRNLQYRDPRPSEEYLEDGCFSGGETSTPVDVSKHVHPNAEDSAHRDHHNGVPDIQTNEEKSDDETHQNAIIKREKDHGSQDSETNLYHGSSSGEIHVKGSVTKKPLMSPEHKKPTSLLHTVFGVEKGQPQGSSTSCKTPKRRSTVKAISSSTTRMMFVLTALFVINYFPYLIVLSVRAVSNNFGWGLTGTLLNAYNIGLRSYIMNCAINPIVYGFFSPRFRQECQRLFCGQR